MSDIFIYTHQTSPRLEYILEVLLGNLLGLTYKVSSNLSEFVDVKLPKINYGNNDLTAKAIHIKPQGLLQSQVIEQQSIKPTNYNSFTIFFEQDTDFGFDIFAASFYLLVRYEEYLPFKSDQYGRFPATESLAYQANFLEQPLIHHWAAYLKAQLFRQFSQLSFQPPKFKFQPTFDIDLAWAFQHRSFYRTAGAIVKDLVSFNFDLLIQRLQILLRLRPDPFFVFEELKILHNQYEFKPIFFFLLGNYGVFDKNIAHQKKALQQLIQTLDRDYEVGIHPSYASNSSVELLKKELQRLQTIIQKPVKHNRQHFLKLSFPNTYQNLIQLGIKQDFTMGYADEIGFRASIAIPFYWYDLSKEVKTKLLIHPFQVMDVTLKQYLALSPEVGLEKISNLIDRIEEVGGTYCTLWHNSSFSHLEGWQGWKKMYENMLAYAYQKSLNADYPHTQKHK